MWPFGKRSKLLRELDRLAFYNDKGIDYARHNAAQVDAERATRIARIEGLVRDIGRESFPITFLDGLDSGAVSTDLTGDFMRQVKVHFKARLAP